MTVREACLVALAAASGVVAVVCAAEVVVYLLSGNLLHAAWRGVGLYGAAWGSRWAWCRSHPQPDRSDRT